MSVVPHPSERLTDLWRLGPSEVVALVGAGGKTSLMEALARDFEAEGALVLLATTTKIRPPGPGGRRLVIAPRLEELLEALGDVVGPGDPPAGRSPVVGRGLTADGKVEGVPPEWVPALRDLPGVAAVLVEADGSAGRPLKAPAPYEPVVPSCASLVVAVAGLDAQGARLDEGHVHRPELLARSLGLPVGAPVPPADLLRASVEGYERRAPSHAGFLVFLNKADVFPAAPDLVAACAAADVEVWSGAVGAGVVERAGGPREAGRPAPGAEVGVRRMVRLGGGDPRPSIVIPAAGLAVRMGGPKVLAALGEGTVLDRVVAAARESGVAREVVVVAGTDAATVAAGLSASAPPSARVVRNDHPEEGMSSSLRAGLEALRRPSALLVMLGDQPFVRPATLRRLVDEHGARPRAAAVGLAGGPGGTARPPVLLHRSLVPLIGELRGDEGARRLLARHAASVVLVTGEPDEGFDVDRPEDLERARGLVSGRGDAPPSDPPRSPDGVRRHRPGAD